MNRISVTVNGRIEPGEVEGRTLLVHFLRDTLRLTGTHVGCETGYCGACTVLLDGRPAKSCLHFAVQADGADIVTIEGLADDGDLHPVQEAFREEYALQCGYCTPGMIMSAVALLAVNGEPSRDEIVTAIDGNLCRCTGYLPIIAAIRHAAGVMQGGEPGGYQSSTTHTEPGP
jgi:carbon-monoxide dehydrogenase small subunit